MRRDSRAAGDRRHRPPTGVVVLLVVVSAVVGAVRSDIVGAQAPDPVPPAPDGLPPDVLGAFLYGRDCAGCHGPEGQGSPRGVPLLEAGEAIAHYTLVTGRMPLTAEDEEPGRQEPAYEEEALRALVDHVAALGDGPPLPDVDWRDADVSDGGVLYRLHCGACHGATAVGGALAYGETAPSLMESEPSVVAAAVITGPGAMPSFAPLGFTEEELAQIVAYVQEVQTPVGRGGWPIARAGRADEGLFAWLVAVPAFLLVAAWIARRVR